ncbi:hypothetical protein FZEAL_9619 [Fusarium zealandicum]|uniref:Uncharacterized protein n=1 Tax=Fusarium zealandicum TaxID=1053134 RepID=A0A8H4XFI7_9HYPO|nr:hypothetical protein FZEAL_9619 [Fusarium zealandicum]
MKTTGIVAFVLAASAPLVAAVPYPWNTPVPAPTHAAPAPAVPWNTPVPTPVAPLEARAPQVEDESSPLVPRGYNGTATWNANHGPHTPIAKPAGLWPRGYNVTH